jgi:hypothetical protein
MTILINHRHFKSRYRHLDIDIDVQQCEFPDDERQRIQHDLELLADELLEFPASQLRLSIVYHPRQEEYHAQAWLKLPGKRFVSGRYSPWLDYSVMRCLAKLRRHVESYRENPNSEAIRETERRLELQNHVVPPTERIADALEKAIQRQDYRAFRRALSGYEDRMRAQVANWVRRYPQMTRLLGEDIEIEDIVEEVFLMAFDEFPVQQEKTISEWLRQFIDPAVKAIWHDESEREAAEFARTFGTASELLAQPPAESNRRAPK